MLLTISEAAKRMGPGVETVCPGQPWHKIRGMGNWLRHQYDRIDLQSMWDTVTDDLPPLKAAVLLALAREKSSNRKDRRKAEHAGSVNAFGSRGQHGRSSKPNRAAALSRRRRRVNLNERRL